MLAAFAVAVDMTAQIAGGKFDTNSQEVWVRGNKISWDIPPQGLQLFADASRSGVYTNTVLMDSAITGDTVEFKFTTWEDGANKTVTFSGTEPTGAAGYHLKSYGAVYFNGISPSDICRRIRS